MLRVVGIGSSSTSVEHDTVPYCPREGLLLEFNGCRLLVGCPSGIHKDLARLDLSFEDIHAVLLTSARSLDGLAEFHAGVINHSDTKTHGVGDKVDFDVLVSTCQRPRVLGTAPVIAAAAAHFEDLFDVADAEDIRRRVPQAVVVDREQVSTILASMEEVNLREEIVIEGPKGSVIVTPSHSGYCLGGVYWLLETSGVKVAIVHEASLSELGTAPCMDAKSLAGLHAIIFGTVVTNTQNSEAPLRPSTMHPPKSRLTQAVSEIIQTLESAGSTLVPIGNAQVLTIEIVETLGKAITKLPESLQAPIFVVGGVSRFLRRCLGFGEWTNSERIAHLHMGRSPFLIEKLMQTGRLTCANHPPELANAYREPCIVLAPACTLCAGSASHFQSLWSASPPARVSILDLGSDHIQTLSSGTGSIQLPCIGQTIDMRLCLSDLCRLLSSAAPQAVVVPFAIAPLLSASGVKSPILLEFNCAEFTGVPLDLRTPCALGWLSPATVCSAEAILRKANQIPGDLASAGFKKRKISTSTDRASGHAFNELIGEEWCCFDGVSIGTKSPCITSNGNTPASDVPSSGCELDVENLLETLKLHGLHGERLVNSTLTEVVIPALKARVVLECPLHGSVPTTDMVRETIVEAPTKEARRLIGSIVEGLLFKP